LTVNPNSRQHIRHSHGFQLLMGESHSQSNRLVVSEHWLEATYQCLARFATAWHQNIKPLAGAMLKHQTKTSGSWVGALHTENKRDQ